MGRHELDAGHRHATDYGTGQLLLFGGITSVSGTTRSDTWTR